MLMDPQQALSPSPANYWMVTPEMLHQYEMAQLMSQHQYVPVTAHQPIPNVQVTPVIEHWPTSNIAPTPAISKNQPLGIPPVPKQMDQYSSHEITKWAFELDECARAEIKEKKVRPGRETIADRKCDDCGLDLKSSPAMRRGPRGPNTLCNRCGLRFAKRKNEQQPPSSISPPSASTPQAESSSTVSPPQRRAELLSSTADAPGSRVKRRNTSSN